MLVPALSLGLWPVLVVTALPVSKGTSVKMANIAQRRRRYRSFLSVSFTLGCNTCLKEYASS